MKILTIVVDLDKGGTQRAAQVFTEAYKELGHDSRILSLYGLGLRYEEIKDFIKVYLSASEINLKEIKQWSPDIIHIHSHGVKEEDINKIFDLFSGSSVKFIETNVFSAPSAWEDKLDFSFQLSSWALWLYTMRGGNQSKSVVVPYPVKCDNFIPASLDEVNKFKKQYNIPQDSFVIGRIGQTDHAKWSPMLIDVFNKLSKITPNLYLVIINAPHNVLQVAAKSPFKKNIIHIPKIYGDKDLSIAYSVFDLMIHIAEKGESFGYVLAESILCKTPVITLSTPWADNSQGEVVVNLQGGYVVNNARGIIKAFNHYINLEESNKFIDLGRSNIYQKYNYLQVAKKSIDFSKSNKYNSDLSNINISDEINKILKNTFDKTNRLVFLLINSKILFFRRLTLFNYPLKYLWPVLVKKFLKK